MRAPARTAIGLAVLAIVVFAASRTTSEAPSSDRAESTRSGVLAPRPRATRTRTRTVIEDPAPPSEAAPVVETKPGRTPSDVAADREATLRVEVPRTAYRLMDQLIADAVRNGRAFNPAMAPERQGDPQPGTLAAARRWSHAELFSGLWQKVAAELRAKNDELEKHWKARDKSQMRRATYGSGTFIVVRRPTAGADAPRPNAGRPTTEEEWWSLADSAQRIDWLTASFVESSGFFEIVGAPQESCVSCDGAGRYRDGVVCPRCNGCGVVRSVDYR